MVDDSTGRHGTSQEDWLDRLRLAVASRFTAIRSPRNRAEAGPAARWSVYGDDDVGLAPIKVGATGETGRRLRSREALFVSHADTVGGAEIFLFDIMDVYRQTWDSCFLCHGASAKKARARGFDPIVIEGSPSVLQLTRSSSLTKSVKAAAGLMAAAVKLARVARDYECIVANSQKALFVSALASVIARRPLVWILHDILLDSSFSKATLKAAVLTANRFATAVIANSEATRASFGAAGGDLSKTSVVYNGFHLDQFHEPSEAAGRAIREEFGLDERPVVGLFGRLTRWKGQHILLEALAKAPDVQAIVVGGMQAGEEDYAREIKDLAVSLGVMDRVRFVSFRDDVYRLMSGVDVVLHTSTSAEPFGRVVVEGMLSGRPVIATAGGGVNEIVDHETTGLLVPPNDPDALAAALTRVVRDPLLAARIAAGGVVFARRTFDVVAVANRIDAVIRSATRKVGLTTKAG